ncbi:MAG: hypothetical protein J7521_14745 [Caulobacter sp.]|nr:hypothetical protein [Caulobacter sp.]
MTSVKPPIDALSEELRQLAEAYAGKAEALADDPYYRDAVMKVAVSQFVWSLYHAFDDRSRTVLAEELAVQTAAVQRAVSQEAH